MSKSCSNCKNYSKLDSQCREELRVAFIGTPAGPKITAGFPEVKPEWWCRKHEIDIGALS